MKIQWKSMPFSEKGKAKKNTARARKVARKKKKAIQAKVTEKRQQNIHDSKVNVETAESTDTKLLIVGTSRRPNLKGKGTGKSKSTVTEISESDSNEQVEETWTSNTSTPQLEDSKKRRYTVNGEDQFDWKTEEHELMIDSGCFGHVFPPWFAPQFPMVSSTNVEAVAANNVALQHYGQKVVDGHVMTNSGRRILIQITFDVMNVRKPFLSISALKLRDVTIIFNHDHDRFIFRNETVILVFHDCHPYLKITLTNGIPPRKVMVMTGENAANDLDEELYGNDGA